MSKPRDSRMRFKKSHGMYGTRTYRIWRAMKSRCFREKHAAYRRYGGRGITVCQRWLGFEQFLADMGTCPSERHSIDRINNDGNYEPGNCRWATPLEQSRNAESNKLLEVNGRTMCVSEWAYEIGMVPTALHTRLRRGWSPERAVTQPVRKQKGVPQ